MAEDSRIKVFPDDETLQMALYGPSYGTVKSTLSQLDRIAESCKASRDRMVAGMDPSLAHAALALHEGLVRSEEEIPDDIDVFTARAIIGIRGIVRMELAMEFLCCKREDVIRYGRFVGAMSHSNEMQRRGISTEEWLDASMRYGGHRIGGNP